MSERKTYVGWERLPQSVNDGFFFKHTFLLNAFKKFDVDPTSQFFIVWVTVSKLGCPRVEGYFGQSTSKSDKPTKTREKVLQTHWRS